MGFLVENFQHDCNVFADLHFFISLSLREISRTFEGNQKRIVQEFAIGSSFSPLLLSVFGLDFFRWGMLTVFTSFIVLVLCTKKQNLALSPPWRWLFNSKLSLRG
jgi:hypothetical protein